MAKYEFKLPDIGEGIAEAEIVAWHVKIGDRIEEDQPLADMMTDKATVEMETPVAGKIVELAGEVGDQIPIGSVLAVIETDARAAVSAESKKEVPIADGTAEANAEQEEAMPTTAVEDSPVPVRPERSEAQSKGAAAKEAPAPTRPASGRGAHALASPAVRQRARDLGIDLAEVKTAGDRVRHSDLDA
jgi:2-oxoisovalerate dehydrogenase E2 component (dihydrolipoyl transacylase)